MNKWVVKYVKAGWLYHVCDRITFKTVWISHIKKEAEDYCEELNKRGE